MNFVKSSNRSTLLLNNAWQPIAIITSRAAFTHLLKGSVTALDKDSQAFNSIDSWNKYAKFYDDQPIIRSAKQHWPIPTVVVVTHKFFRRPKKKILSTVDLAKILDSTCQYCLKKFPLKDLTIDHIKPRSKGGTNEYENRILACFKCNSTKSSIYPYLNVNGESVKPPSIPSFLLENTKIREEWKNFIYTSI